MSIAKLRKLEEEIKKIEESYKFYSPIYETTHVATYNPIGNGDGGVLTIHQTKLSAITAIELGKWASKQMKRSVK